MSGAWGEGWASDFGGAPTSPDQQIPGTDRMGIAIRAIIAAAMDMDPLNVVPGNQGMPSGRTDRDYATFRIIMAEDAGWRESSISGPVGSTVETISVPQYLTVSVNFFRSKNQKTDDAGRPRFSTGAFDRAVRLPKRLQLAAIHDLMLSYGIGFISASPARNLAGLGDGNWETRGQVDLTLSVVAQESSSLGTFTQVGGIAIKVENPAGVVATIITP